MPWPNDGLLFQYRFMRPINLCGYLTQIKTNGCSLRSSIHLHLIAGAQGLMITNISLRTAAQSPNTFPFNDFSSFLVIFFLEFSVGSRGRSGVFLSVSSFFFAGSL